MLHASPPSRPEASLSQSDFSRIARIARTGWGLNLEQAKMPLIQSRLGRRLKALNLPSFSDYCELLESGKTPEVENFVSALTTNVTHFYRELHHFEKLENEILPNLIEKARSGSRIRIWSAGCSTGQEPYSIAASVVHVAKDLGQVDLKILATDVDAQVLKTAQSGTYLATEIDFPTSEHKRRVFDTSNSDRPKVKEGLRNLITFRKLNLMDTWPISGKFDIIMCRNVAIYFDRPTQEKLWSRFSEVMPVGGQLFIGHSERIANPERFAFSPNGVTSYYRSANCPSQNLQVERSSHGIA